MHHFPRVFTVSDRSERDHSGAPEETGGAGEESSGAGEEREGASVTQPGTWSL